MPSLGCLLLLSLTVALISPSSGFYRKPQCPKVVNSCRTLTPCREDAECGSTQICCDSGCGQRCINRFFNFFANMFSCGGGRCGQSSSGCSGGGCGQSSGQYGRQYERQYGGGGGGGGGFFWKKKK